MSTNPYNLSSSFMELLHSEPDSQNLESNPYESYSPTIELGSSEFPGFSSQCTDEPSLGEATPQEKKERKKWTPQEDVVLISAWLNTRKDHVVGNEQKAVAFWKCISKCYASSDAVAGLPKRELIQCKQRWQKINDQVCKFVGSYNAATAQYSSGQSQTDIMKAADKIFFNDHKFKFTLQHAWLELCNDQKWCASGTTKTNVSSKRRKCDEGTAASSSSQPVSNGEGKPMGRPPGVKAAKKQAKRTVEGEGKALLEFQTMWKIKQQDMAMRDKLSNKKLLECLLAKTEPLTDLELTQQKKLTIELF